MMLFRDHRVAATVVIPGVCHVGVMASAFLCMELKDKSDVMDAALYRTVFLTPCGVNIDNASTSSAITHAACDNVAECSLRGLPRGRSSKSSKQYSMESTQVLYFTYHAAHLCYESRYHTLSIIPFLRDHALGAGQLSSASEF
jgi:hypothetical protein